MTQATSTVQVENATTLITRWDLPPGASTGPHVHQYDYVVVPITDGVLSVTMPDGERIEAPLTVGTSYARSAGVEHDVANLTSEPIAFIEVELLEHSLGG